ncbi:TrkH family potassium uptake protein [Corynebacterium sp. HS2168-gen11]|uniref:TrkH family potassium uptake protein n=1 Tax=Corynebacterium sp. HS2168-gen11 TaxID=2974027 RepID=UPI00216AB5BD|nr:potassium transporter TrkG [Corynebacterium sp. HS2168-gen11]MCS4536425.1 TrkH family potassium uptake protein [Corynebacterium sp. HS2168-gen11]
MRYSPAQLVAVSFLCLIGLGTGLLCLPVSRNGSELEPMVALFTATSAACLTGLTVVDTATYWSHFGQLVIIGLVQLGGLGIMTLATIAGWAIVGNLGVRSRLNANAEGRGLHLGDVKTLLIATISFTVMVELIIGIILSVRFHNTYHYQWPAATWEGTFHAISAFNNAGFGLRTSNMMQYVSDPTILLPVAVAIILGGLGFPTLLELYRKILTPTRLGLTTVFTVYGTVILLLLGTLATVMFEWNGVLGELSTFDKWLSAFFHSVSSRTAGFNSIDISSFHPNALMATNILMLIGGGSGGTAGGVKITTIAVIFAVVWAEVKGNEDVTVRGRRLPPRTIRQALSVITISVVVVLSAMMTVLIVAPHFTTAQLAFEVISAFSTVGLSTGITPFLPSSAQLVLIVLMYAGRIGPITLVAALAARDQQRYYSYPEERPFIG